VDILSAIQSISTGCFSRCHSICSVKFASCCRISNLRESAFEICSSLQSVSILSSIETISKSCFSLCRALSNVIFEPCPRISSLGQCAFWGCSELRSMCVPASVETMPLSSFGSNQVYIYRNVRRDRPFTEPIGKKSNLLSASLPTNSSQLSSTSPFFSENIQVHERYCMDTCSPHGW
jgi:hypothetical protein